MVILGPSTDAKGAVVVRSSPVDKMVETLPLAECLNLLRPDQVIDAVCMQERLHGSGNLKPPDLS